MAGQTRRRRPATVARIAVTGISTAGTFAIIGALSSAASTSNASASADTEAPEPVVTETYVEDTEDTEVDEVDEVDDTVPVVVIEVHRTVYVDEHGNPVDPSSLTTLAGGTVPTRTAPPVEVSQVTKKTAKPTTATTVKKKKKKKKSSGSSGSSGSGGSGGTTATTAPKCSGSSC